jgi:hypothetical protein
VLTQLNDSVYEFYRPPDGESVNFEIIFFHGLVHGDSSKAYVETWTSNVKSEPICWLQGLLAQDCPRARILSVSYDSSIEKGLRHGNLDLYRSAENLVQDLVDSAKVAALPGVSVVLVGKDLGGLLIKAICMQAKAKPEPPNRLTFLKNLKGVFYYGTPHLGVKDLPAAYNGALAKKRTLGDTEIARPCFNFANYRKLSKVAARAIMSLQRMMR